MREKGIKTMKYTIKTTQMKHHCGPVQDWYQVMKGNTAISWHRSRQEAEYRIKHEMDKGAK